MERTSLKTSNMIEADTWGRGQYESRSWAVGVPPGKEMRLSRWYEKANNKKKKKGEREKENPQLATDSPTERKKIPMTKERQNSSDCD